MASWAALNAESAPRPALEEARDAATEEAQEAQNAALYGRALRLQQQQKVEEATSLYTELLETASGLSARLRYLCAKNLATLEAERRAYDAALRRFSDALALDGTDVLVWYHMGKAALETGQSWLARQAFEAGFQLDATFWPLVHALCDVLHAVGDSAAYERVAQFLLERDPDAGAHGGPLSVMDMAVDPEHRVCLAPSTVMSTQTLVTRKRPTPAQEASVAAAKKRKVLTDASSQKDEAVVKRAPLQYLLQRGSWVSLGKLLLEAYDDVTSEQDSSRDTWMRPVCVRADFVDEPSAPQLPNSSTMSDETAKEAIPAIELVAEEDTSVVDLTESGDKFEDGTAIEPIEVDDGDDGDQEDGPSASQSSRRKSRRHQEKLREEHELAAKLAREKNLAYRLQAYIPATINRRSISEYAPIVFCVKGDSVILQQMNGDVVHKFENVLPSAPADTAADSVKASDGDDSDHTASEPKTVDRERVQNFVDSKVQSTDGLGITDLLCSYLNQCGEWADQSMVPLSHDEDQALHLVCLWAEKAVRGRLGASPTTPTAREIEKTSRGRVTIPRHSKDGLTLEARLFLLELRLDDLTHQHSQQPQGRSRKTSRSYLGQLEDVVRLAQSLLLDICWSGSEEHESETDAKTKSKLLVRLFWLCGSANQLRGNTAAAKEYFAKCKQSLEEMDQPALVSLPNLRSPTSITILSVEQKITGLHFTNVCTDAREVVPTSRFDEAQGRLLSHFFPTNGQDSRIGDLLDDFSAFKHQERDRRDDSSNIDATDTGSSLIEQLLETIENSTSSSPTGKMLILLVILSKLLEVLTENLVKAKSRSKKAEKEKHTLGVAVQAIEMTVDKLASVVVADQDAEANFCLNSRRALMSVVTVLLEPKILLLFDSPRDVLQVIHEMADQLDVGEEDSNSSDIVFSPLVVAAAKSFQTIRSLSPTERERMLTVLSAPAFGTKPKKKQSSRLDRIRSYSQSVLSLLAAHTPLVVSMLPTDQVKRLLEGCCTLLKEEEEMTKRYRDGDKVARRTLAVGAVLFVQLVVAVSSREDKEVSLKEVVGLVRLLHERLGEHELCSLKCFDKTIGTGSCPGESFVQVAGSILHDRHADHESLQLSRRRLKELARKPNEQSKIADNNSDCELTVDEENVTNEGGNDQDGYDHTLAQCYRCLYDVHLLGGCVDHKSGGSIVGLDGGSGKMAQELAQFAIPVMLRSPPRSNAHKKENLKILFAIQRAIDFTADDKCAPARPLQQIIDYLSPKSLLSWDVEVPVDALRSTPPAHEGSCLEDLWFLLGDNFILHRVRKRSNLIELAEMERKIKERIAYLLKDVQCYRPRRIKSWIRLGRSTKELYQVASDACALILGRKWRKRNLLLPTQPRESHGKKHEGFVEACFTQPPPFDQVVLKASLFEKMKVWHEMENPSDQSSYRVLFKQSETTANEAEADTISPAWEYSIEEVAELYLTQVVEFSRRCFAMAVALATSDETRKDRTDADEADTTDLSVTAESDEDITELMQTAVDACEDCGLVMYNQIQEFAMLRHDDEVVSSGRFPASFYEKLLNSALEYFRKGLRLSAASNPDAHDVRFRLHYMIGKVLKKHLWLQQLTRRQPNLSDHTSAARAFVTAEDVMKSFAKAEQEHEDGKMDKSIVHAFYQLQAMRLMLTISEPTSIKSLRLACDHFFEEVADDDSDEDKDGDDEMGQEKKTEDTSVTGVRVGKDEVAAILKASEDTEGKESEQLLHLAQGWLFFNVVDALESISDEDRYFHASRYALAKAMYHYCEIVERLSSIGEELQDLAPSTSSKMCIAALAEKKTKKKNDGDTAADIALKELHPLFDKRRPQVVAIWLSEHVPASKKFEELNQRQIKVDCCRLKYFSYFVKLLQESEAYSRLKEIGSWVLACKEEHDAIDEMLGSVLHARGVVQLTRLREYMSTELEDQLEQRKTSKPPLKALQGEVSEVGNVVGATTENHEHSDMETASEGLMKELSKAYVNYLDVVHSSSRLANVMPETTHQEVSLLAEFPVVCLYLVGAAEFPRTFRVLDSDEVLTASHVTTVTLKLRAIVLNDLSLTECASVDWKPLLHAARAFCEDRWPDRRGNKTTAAGKQTKKPRHGKLSGTVATTTAAPTDIVATMPSATSVPVSVDGEQQEHADSDIFAPPAAGDSGATDSSLPAEI